MWVFRSCLFLFTENTKTVSICLFKPPWLGALYSHWLQEYLTFLCNASMWFFRFPFVVSFHSHQLQGYLTFSWTAWICFSRFPVVAWYLHWLQFFPLGWFNYDLSPVLTELWQKRFSLRVSLFSCLRGRAAPDTLNDHSPWSNHQSGAFPAARSEGIFWWKSARSEGTFL